MIPVSVKYLNETNSTFHQAARQQEKPATNATSCRKAKDVRNFLKTLECVELDELPQVVSEDADDVPVSFTSSIDNTF